MAMPAPFERPRCSPGPCRYTEAGVCVHCRHPRTSGSGPSRRRVGRGHDTSLPGGPATLADIEQWDAEASNSDPPPGSQPAANADGSTRDVSPTSAAPWERFVTPAPEEWFQKPPPGRTWLLRDGRFPNAEGLLPLGKVGQLIAEGGAGKTMAMFQLAVAVATGVRWLGTFDVATTGRVLLLVGEEDAEEAHRRLFRARRAMNAPTPEPDAIVLLPLAGVPCPDARRGMIGVTSLDAPFLTWLQEWLVAHGPWALVIVDPLSRFAGPRCRGRQRGRYTFCSGAGVNRVAHWGGRSSSPPHEQARQTRRGD